MDATVTDHSGLRHGPVRGRRKLLRDLLRENPEVDPYPEGWFVIEFSDRVKTNRLTSKKFFGEDVVLYRHPKTREVIVTQGYCPHLGAHFDSYKNGGCLENGVIVCPYHHLRFDPLSQMQNRDGAGPGKMDLKIYPTIEYHGFVLALRQRDERAPQLPKPDLSFPEVNDDEFLYDTQSVGVFKGDCLIPLMANADYMHFQTVHGTPEPVCDHVFTVSPDGKECYFSFEMLARNKDRVDAQYPRAGNFRGLRRMFARPSTPAAKLPDVLTRVTAAGIGAGLAKSRWWEPQFGIDLLSWLYVTPIDPFTYELYMCHGAKTIKNFNSKPIQHILNTMGLQAHMFANHLYVGQEDPPFYNADKIRLNRPAYRPKDQIIEKYISWWKSNFFAQEYLEMIDGYDLDFT